MIEDLHELETGALIDLWQIDISRISGTPQWFYFTNQLNQKREPFVIFNGKKYNSLPVDFSGASKSTTGVSSRPTLVMGNIEGLFTGLISEFGGLIGADVIRFIVPVKFLDAENFPEGNPHANNTEYQAQRFIVQSAKESAIQGELELSWITELEGVTIPNKPMLANVCAWQYRGIGCGYDGPAVAEQDGTATNDITKDECGKSLHDCKARWGANAVLPALMFVGIDKL